MIWQIRHRNDTGTTWVQHPKWSVRDPSCLVAATWEFHSPLQSSRPSFLLDSARGDLIRFPSFHLSLILAISRAFAHTGKPLTIPRLQNYGRAQACSSLTEGCKLPSCQALIIFRLVDNCNGFTPILTKFHIQTAVVKTRTRKIIETCKFELLGLWTWTLQGNFKRHGTIHSMPISMWWAFFRGLLFTKRVMHSVCLGSFYIRE